MKKYTDDLRALTIRVSDNKNPACVSCSHLKKELHQLRMKNITLRDDCNKLRDSLSKSKKCQSDIAPQLIDAKAK